MKSYLLIPVLFICMFADAQSNTFEESNRKLWELTRKLEELKAKQQSKLIIPEVKEVDFSKLDFSGPKIAQQNSQADIDENARLMKEFDAQFNKVPENIRPVAPLPVSSESLNLKEDQESHSEPISSPQEVYSSSSTPQDYRPVAPMPISSESLVITKEDGSVKNLTESPCFQDLGYNRYMSKSEILRAYERCESEKFWKSVKDALPYSLGIALVIGFVIWGFKRVARTKLNAE